MGRFCEKCNKKRQLDSLLVSGPPKRQTMQEEKIQLPFSSLAFP